MNTIARLTLVSSEGVKQRVVDITSESLQEVKRREGRRIMIEKEVYVLTEVEEMSLSEYARYAREKSGMTPPDEMVLRLIDDIDAKKRKETAEMTAVHRLATVLEWINLFSFNPN